MSKPNSGHFRGTAGDVLSRYTLAGENGKPVYKESAIIASRVKGFDLREHPLKYKQLSSSKMNQLSRKASARTMTRLEYKTYDSNRRLIKRRDKGVNEFWKQEAKRILTGAPTTRVWTPKQQHDIIHNRKPKQNGKTFQSHHTYSVSRYPHLANRGEVIYPATFSEHLYGWHGGNFHKSLPGRPINHNKLHQD